MTAFMVPSVVILQKQDVLPYLRNILQTNLQNKKL